MKKSILILLMTLFLIPSPAWAAPPDSARVIYRTVGGHGEYLETQPPPFIDNGRMLIPLRAVTESMHFQVQWNPLTREVSVSDQDRTVALTIGAREAEVNGQTRMLEVPARIIADRTFVPLRFVSEMLGYNVYYHEPTRTAFVTYDQLVSPLEIDAIMRDKTNFQFNSDGPGGELKADGATPSGIRIGDPWDKIRQVYGRPLTYYLYGDAGVAVLPAGTDLNRLDSVIVSYSSPFTPHSGDVVILQFHLHKGTLTSLGLSYT